MQEHDENKNKYLNFPACVWMVTENPRTPNVFLQEQNTEYLARNGQIDLAVIYKKTKIFAC